jgi:hypothetical protein
MLYSQSRRHVIGTEDVGSTFPAAPPSGRRITVSSRE